MFSQLFFGMPSELMTALATILGFAFTEDLTVGQQNSLSGFFFLIAQIMSTNASQAQLLEGNAQNKQLSDMQEAIAQLQEEVKRLKGVKE